MDSLERLFALMDAVNETASNEGCEDEYAVVSGVALVALSREVARLRLAGKSKQEMFVSHIAALHIWDYDNQAGAPYVECDEPSDGYLDSHCCLMDLIESARELVAENRRLVEEKETGCEQANLGQ